RLNTSELKYQSYILNMKRKIELRWRYPEMAVANGWQGILSIDFSINRDGSLGDVVVKKSSGYPVLDDAAVTALRLAGPYPPFPEDFFVERINIKAQFEYLIRLRPGR
ncbi:MAG: energy transducer TonB, partial [Thermodesulfobacteriota bacterium]